MFTRLPRKQFFIGFLSLFLLTVATAASLLVRVEFKAECSSASQKTNRSLPNTTETAKLIT